MSSTIATGAEYESLLNIEGYMKDIYANTDPSIVQLVEFHMNNLHNAFSGGKYILSLKVDKI